jgi:uncharacterized protein YprB with RNaseH-like and TPR domain
MAINIANYKKDKIIKMNGWRCEHSHTGIEHPQCYLKAHGEDLKRCFFDIETTGLQGNWDYMLTYSIKPEGSDDIICGYVTKKEVDEGTFDKRIVQECINNLMKFDRVYTFYGTKFDIPFLRTRALELGIDFPIYGSLSHKDVYYIARFKMKLHSNRLEVVCDLLGIKGKTHQNPATWRSAKSGNKKALEEILEHNKGDVIILEQVYNRLKDFTKELDKSI